MQLSLTSGKPHLHRYLTTSRRPQTDIQVGVTRPLHTHELKHSLGPTQTGSAPFLAETNPAPFGDPASFAPNEPLETALPIAGDTSNTSIFTLVGQLRFDGAARPLLGVKKLIFSQLLFSESRGLWRE